MSMQKYYASRKDPFSKLSVGAKIPDGKATVSNPIRVQSALELNVLAGEGTLLFYPGLQGGIVTTELVNASATTTRGFANGIKLKKDIAVTGVESPFTQEPTNRLLKWRVVSSALRCSLVNNADENDGWFEAIRVEPQYNDPLDEFMTKTQADDDGTREVRPTNATVSTSKGELPFIDVNKAWTNHPTYVTGKIRDIHQYLWKLNSIAADHEFSNVPALGDHTIATSLDKHYDCIAIKFHGRTTAVQATTGTAGTSPTRIVCHVVSNQEMIFDEDSMMSMSATAGANTRRKTLASVGDSSAPARGSRSGNTFGYSGMGLAAMGSRRRSVRMTTKRKVYKKIRAKRKPKRSTTSSYTAFGQSKRRRKY